jgi:hypothetical protein
MSLITDLAALFHHYPHALHDLMHHEDKTLVQKAHPKISRTKSTSPQSHIEKSIDPAITRTGQNLDLLVRDYLHTLPGYESENHIGEALLEHWRKILQEQPKRIAEAHLESWNTERSRHFWHERLTQYHTDFGIHADHFPNALDDWERAAGTVPPPTKALAAMKTKQWEDLIIRQRIHLLDLHNMGIDHPSFVSHPLPTKR